MEPLHRWLESGERGYKLTCVQKFQQQGHIAPRQHERVAAIAFADDNNLLTGSTSNMLTQCKKIGRWVEWSGMQLNVEKCSLSAAYRHTIKEGISNPDQYDRYLTQTTQELQPIKLFEQQPKQVPPTIPFKFLGVYMQLKNTPSFMPTIPTLIPETFTTQAQATTTKVEQKARAILNSQLTPNQKLIVSFIWLCSP